MRVLMPMAYRADQGGLHDHVEELAISLAPRGVEVTVAGRGGPYFDRLHSNGIKTLELDYSDSNLADAIASECEWDIIHAHPFESRALAVEVKERLDVPVVVTMHGWYADDIAEWHQHVDAIVGVTPAISDRIIREFGVQFEKVRTIPNQLRLTRPGPPAPGKSRARRLVVASRIDRDFGPTESIVVDFLDAAAESGEQDWEIILAGTGSELPNVAARLAARLRSLRGSRLSVVGWQSKRELIDLLSTASCCISPGRSAIDAMSVGVPTVLTRQIGSYAFPPVGRVHELFSGTPGVRVSGREFYQYCSSLISDPDRFDAFVLRQKTLVELYYDPKALTDQIYALYEELAGHVF